MADANASERCRDCIPAPDSIADAKWIWCDDDPDQPNVWGHARRRFESGAGEIGPVTGVLVPDPQKEELSLEGDVLLSVRGGSQISRDCRHAAVGGARRASLRSTRLWDTM